MCCATAEENKTKISIEMSFSLKQRPAADGNELFALAALFYVGLRSSGAPIVSPILCSQMSRAPLD